VRDVVVSTISLILLSASGITSKRLNDLFWCSTKSNELTFR